jgi:NDP-sugar pyrophosphorylase family protein
VRCWLRDYKIIFEDKYLEDWFCDDCNSSHTIQTQGNTRFYICSGDKKFLSKYNTQLWKFDYQRLIKNLAGSLDLNPPVKEIVSNKVWQVGRITSGDRIISVYYNKEESVPHSIVSGSVVINPKVTKHISDDILLLSLGEFVNLTSKGLLIEKDYFEQIVLTKFKSVIFRDNGDLVVNGRVIVSVKSTTPEYYFLECLWSDFDKPQGHEYIHEYCGKQLARSQGLEKWQDSSSDQDYCNKRKSAISSKAKTKADKDLLDQVIKKSRTQDRQNAYRLTNPQ